MQVWAAVRHRPARTLPPARHVAGVANVPWVRVGTQARQLCYGKAGVRGVRGLTCGRGPCRAPCRARGRRAQLAAAPCRQARSRGARIAGQQGCRAKRTFNCGMGGNATARGADTQQPLCCSYVAQRSSSARQHPQKLLLEFHALVA